MRVIQTLAMATAIATSSTASLAQFVKGNEAVKVMSDGSRKVETPPTAGALLAKPCPAKEPGCSGGGWKMVETSSGLMECTEIYARPGTCRASTYGTEKRSRLWIVKTKSQWQHCQFPDLSSKCVDVGSLPYSAVQ
jgi:hypothetical protein